MPLDIHPSMAAIHLLQKVIRSAYGAQPLLQDLANRAIDKWRQWNEASGEELFSLSGWARLTDTGRPMDVDIATFETMAKAGLGHTQYFLHSSEDLERAEKNGWGGPRLDQFRRRERGLPLDGVLDANAGMAYADLACKYALSLVEEDGGTKVIFGEGRGEFSEFIRDVSDTSRVTGIITKDGQKHHADFVIVAAGPYTHQIVPELQPFVTATAGNFIFIRVPEHLRDRYRPDVFPTWAWNYSGNSESPGLTGFPIDRHGILKISYRSPKWTNPSQSASSTGNPVSVPAKASEVASTGPPLLPLQETKEFIRENMPELVGAEIVAARMCWYTDSTDLNFVIDRVPGTSNLIIVTAGSGHGFKFLPVLGEYVVDVLEGKSNDYTRLWQWRKPSPEQLARMRTNTTSDERNWHKQALASKEDLKW
ncbi:Sarcosine oxidase [Pleurostoma richardsiae]|uniref:Sarcosine oxidase n=1 Tax=Pleurostoma richardsiae TaxID=41990 RepID=A0AA38VTT5_9PEZI|nr:Sarcosine oxidase [Pleurostoma richardsiae]